MSAISSLDTVWTLLAAMLVFFMQPGFALVEAGLTRSKNTANILMKNFCDYMAGTVLFWLVGFGLMFHGFDLGARLFHGNILDGDGIWRMGDDSTIPAETFLMFQTVFAATTATIVSGAMAERTKFSMYLLYSIFISGLIYPIEGSWSWGGGWLDAMGFHDFAGSTVVHATGGMLALAGAIVLGPRIGKYKTLVSDGKKSTRVSAIPGHNLALCALGVFILWMGWFGFNPGSTIAAEGAMNALSVSHIMLTTNMAAAVGGIVALCYTWIVDGKPSLSMVCNGVLAGLVGITAGCDCVSIPAAAIIGLVSSLLMCGSVWLLDQKLHIDDPVGAVSVHGVGGIVGTILTGLFAYEETGYNLLTQTVGALSVSAYAFFAGLLLFTAIKYTFGLRVESRIEEEGLDIYEHGEAAYN